MITGLFRRRGSTSSLLNPEPEGCQITAWMFGLCGTGTTVPGIYLTRMLTFYLVDYKHMPVSWYAVFGVVYPLWPMMMSPVLGYLGDKTKTRWGRRLPYLLFGTPLHIVFAVLVLSNPFDGRDNPNLLLAYFLPTMMIFEIFMNALLMSHKGLFPEMFSSLHERSAAASATNILTVFTGFLAGDLPPAVISWVGWWWTSVFYAIIAFAATYVSYPYLSEQRFTTTNVKEYPFLLALKSTFYNRAFVALVVASVMRSTASSIITNGTLFFLKYTVKVDSAWATAVFTIRSLTGALSLPLWRRLGRIYEYRSIMILGNVIMILGIPLVALAPTLGLTCASATVIGLGSGAFSIASDVLYADVVDDDELSTGYQRAAMFLGMEAVSWALAYFIDSSSFSLILPLLGYNPDLDVQPPSVELGFQLYMTIPSTIAMFLSICVMLLYPLHGERLARNQADIAAKRAHECSVSTEEPVDLYTVGMPIPGH